MQRLTTFRLIFSFAALLFIAKPFLGFTISIHQPHYNQVHSILVKSFTKRKPEGIKEANASIESIQKLLNNPLRIICSTISLLLLTLFPAVFKSSLNITDKFLSDIRNTLFPPEHAYLLTGKLII